MKGLSWLAASLVVAISLVFVECYWDDEDVAYEPVVVELAAYEIRNDGPNDAAQLHFIVRWPVGNLAWEDDDKVLVTDCPVLPIAGTRLSISQVRHSYRYNGKPDYFSTTGAAGFCARPYKVMENQHGR